MISLNQLSLHVPAVITKINSSLALKYRMTSLGLLPGTPIEVIRRAPLGDPLEIRIRHYSLSLREEEAASIFVTHEEKNNHG